MKRTGVLKAILLISIIGVLFSGFLTFGELGSGKTATCSLSGSGCSAIFGLPTCFYGLVMYLIVLVLAIVGLRSKN